MPARASFLTERYVRDHGVFTNWNAVEPGTPTYLHALRAAGYHTVALGKHHLTKEDEPARPTWTILADPSRGARLRRGARDRRQVHPDRAHRLLRPPRGEGAVGHLPAAPARPQLPGRVGPGRQPDQADPHVGRHADAAPARRTTSTRGTATSRSTGCEQYTGDAPFFAFVGFPGPHDPWDAPREAIDRFASGETSFPRSTRRPDIDTAGSYGRPAQRVPAPVRHRHHDRRRDPRHAPRVRGERLGDRRSGGPDPRRARSARDARRHVGHLHERPRRDGRRPRDDVEVRPVRPGRAGAVDRAAARRARGAGGRRPRRAPRRAGDRAGDRRTLPMCPASDGRSLLGYVSDDDPDSPRRLDQRELGVRRRSTPARTSWSSTRTRWCRAPLFDRAADPTEDVNVVADPRVRGRRRRDHGRPTCGRSWRPPRPAPTPVRSPTGPDPLPVIAGGRALGSPRDAGTRQVRSGVERVEVGDRGFGAGQERLGEDPAALTDARRGR